MDFNSAAKTESSKLFEGPHFKGTSLTRYRRDSFVELLQTYCYYQVLVFDYLRRYFKGNHLVEWRLSDLIKKKTAAKRVLRFAS